MLQQFPKVDSVQIVSRAKIHIPPDVSLQQNRSDDEFEVSFILSFLNYCIRRNFIKFEIMLVYIHKITHFYTIEI